jgi:predicted RNase H-related nuclease YkuK (DUF458 family)
MTAGRGYINPTRGFLTLTETIKEISDFVKADPGRFYRLVIGTDSQTKGVEKGHETDFVTAVVVHRQGQGARYFWQKEKRGKVPTLRDKIYTETSLSLAAAAELVPLLRQAVSPAKYDIEIHIDVGPIGPTREMIKEVVGMVNGNGYTAKTKPESWGASSVADRHT